MILSWALIVLSVLATLVFRGVKYWSRDDFWGDEAALGYNLMTRSFAGLTRPLDQHQSAPVGYLLLEKGLGLSLGMYEPFLRIPSLLAGLGVPLLAMVAMRRLVGLPAAAIGVAILAASPPLTSYSAEMKPYSLDSSISLVLFYILNLYMHSHSTGSLLILGLAGAIATWFSFPAVFVLGGCGGVLILASMLRKDWPTALRLALISVLWAASFAIQYVLAIRDTTHDHVLLSYWAASFAPFPPRSLVEWRWYAGRVGYFFQDPMGLRPRFLALAVFLGGCGLMARDRRLLLGLILAPAGLALLASAMHKYVFAGRLLLFLVPLLVIPIAVFLAELLARCRPVPVAAGSALLFVLLWPALRADGKILVEAAKSGPGRHGSNALLFLKRELGPDDCLVVSQEADWCFTYYALRIGLAPGTLLILPSIPEGRKAMSDHVRSHDCRRCWLLVSTFRNHSPDSEERTLMDEVARIGKKYKYSDFISFNLYKIKPIRRPRTAQ